jgi:DNA-binding transcriptional regulator YiaG
MSSYQANSHAQQNNNNVLDLLRMFRDSHHLSLEQLAGLLRINPLTLEEWFSEEMAPPAAFLALAVLFDTRKQVPSRIG